VIKNLPQVNIVYSYTESSPAAIEALIASVARGIVFAGTGSGSLSSVFQSAIKSILAKPPASRPTLVLASRVGNGRVINRDVYDRLDMIPADNLSPQKARILLMLALTKTTERRHIQRMFADY